MSHLNRAQQVADTLRSGLAAGPGKVAISASPTESGCALIDIEFNSGDGFLVEVTEGVATVRILDPGDEEVTEYKLLAYVSARVQLLEGDLRDDLRAR